MVDFPVVRRTSYLSEAIGAWLPSGENPDPRMFELEARLTCRAWTLGAGSGPESVRQTESSIIFGYVC